MGIDIQVTFDAADPRKLADFWALALDYQPQPPPPGFDDWESFGKAIGVPEERWSDFAALVDPERKGPRLFFQRVPEGKTAKNRVHLDVAASLRAPDPEHKRDAVAEHVRKLEGAGASVLREVEEPHGYWIVMQDPEGNEFCVQ